MNTPVRWTFVRKVELLNEIRAGILSPAEALVRFSVGPEELSRWQELLLLGGKSALMASQAKKYQQTPPRSNGAPHLKHHVPASDDPIGGIEP
jgi:Protein of unknown function (DUF1153)